jgi:cell pole-organizing protein PopZ
VAASKPALKEIVRGPLPPFFGSNPEAAKVEVAPAPPMSPPPMSPPPMPEPSAPAPLPGGGVIPPPPAAIVRSSEGNPARGGAYDSTARAPSRAVGSGAAASAGAAANEGASVAKANASPLQPTADSGGGAAAAGATQLQGLDAMVAELLRPMLRRWLDENMPRLVSAALKAEADNLSRRDPHKP